MKSIINLKFWHTFFIIGWRIFTKGASEIIMSKCSFILGDNGRLDKFTRQARDRCIREVIEPMARDGLRTISVAYRDFVLGKAEINQVIMQNCLGKSRIKCLPPEDFRIRGGNLLYLSRIERVSCMSECNR